MKEIPVYLLIHSCVLRKYRTDRSLFSRVLVSQTKLDKVRIVPSGRHRCGIRQSRMRYGGKLYYDVKNSLPEEAVFIEEGLESVILFNGHEYPVTGAEYIYADELHHIELMLGGAV